MWRYPQPSDAIGASGPGGGGGSVEVALVAGACVYGSGAGAFVGLQPMPGAISRAMVSSIETL